jgi:hypothetical protein
VSVVRAQRTMSQRRVISDEVIASGVFRSDRDWKAYAARRSAPELDPSHVVRGSLWFCHLGLAFLIDLDKQEPGVVGRAAKRAVQRASWRFGLVGALTVGLVRAAAAAARAPELQQQLEDPRTIVVPWSDVVEASHVVVGSTDYLVVTADPGDGSRHTFCFDLGATLRDGVCELVFLFRFFAEKLLVEDELARAGQPRSRELLLARLANLAHVSWLQPYFHGAAIPPAMPPIAVGDALWSPHRRSSLP